MFRKDYLKKPDWLKIKIPSGDEYKSIYRILERHKLSTICQEARCPNIGECWNKKSATIMIMGKVCTRACRFCAVATGNQGDELDSDEPEHVAQVIAALGLKYVVITSVDRDDVIDLGSKHYAETISHVKQTSPATKVEALIPDFNGAADCLARIVDAQPYVIGHNVETVRRLTPYIRDRRCGYERSLEVLAKCKALDSNIFTKSGFMVGLGETEDEIFLTLKDLKKVEVDIVTIGQYLQPTKKHLPVKDYVKPEQFANFRKYGLDLGFKAVFSGPLVRSSYRAELIDAKI